MMIEIDRRLVMRALDEHALGNTGKAFALLANVITNNEGRTVARCMQALADMGHSAACSAEEATAMKQFSDRDYWQTYHAAIGDAVEAIDNLDEP